MKKNELTVKGTQNFMGVEIPIVYGGFGADQKCVCDKTAGEIHGMETKNLRARVTDNIKRFRLGVDFLDFGQRACQTSTSSKFELLQELGYSKQAIAQAEHIYILSERGYLKLVKILDSDEAWNVYEDLVDQYFEKEEKEIKAQTERLASVNNAVKILTPLLERAGCNTQIQLLTAKQLYEKAGVTIPVEIQADKQYFDTVHIARKAGIYYKSSGKPAEKAVNEIIRRLHISEDEYTETWEAKGKWQGTVRKYSQTVIDRVIRWIEDDGCPQDISYTQTDGQEKQYHVIYKERPAA